MGAPLAAPLEQCIVAQESSLHGALRAQVGIGHAFGAGSGIRASPVRSLQAHDPCLSIHCPPSWPFSQSYRHISLSANCAVLASTGLQVRLELGCLWGKRGSRPSLPGPLSPLWGHRAEARRLSSKSTACLFGHIQPGSVPGLPGGLCPCVAVCCQITSSLGHSSDPGVLVLAQFGGGMRTGTVE